MYNGSFTNYDSPQTSDKRHRNVFTLFTNIYVYSDRRAGHVEH